MNSTAGNMANDGKGMTEDAKMCMMNMYLLEIACIYNIFLINTKLWNVYSV